MGCPSRLLDLCHYFMHLQTLRVKPGAGAAPPTAGRTVGQGRHTCPSRCLGNGPCSPPVHLPPGRNCARPHEGATLVRSRGERPRPRRMAQGLHEATRCEGGVHGSPVPGGRVSGRVPRVSFRGSPLPSVPCAEGRCPLTGRAARRRRDYVQ